MNETPDPARNRSLFEAHGRDFLDNRYVYPVLSRRAGGISIGVNINRDKACNFDCVYCQVDRTTSPDSEAVELPRLADELRRLVDEVLSGRIYEETKFRDVPEPLRRLCDIAISGDGEPTMCAQFEQVVAACAEVRAKCPDDVKLVLITNATLLHREPVRRGVEILDRNRGEIWAKLDAGTEAYYRQIARSAVPWQQILDNLSEAARQRPIVIQTLFTRIHDAPPLADEQQAYCDRLGEIVAAGGRIKLVQIHTTARRPAEPWVRSLADAEVDAVAELVRRRTGLPVAVSYGAL
ncbi:MAG: radical SAM protein [Candidatus Nealsonbacteria bacterium]|nr:radical SAM protein [Candidatus Nealsonbacteria bacterium]